MAAHADTKFRLWGLAPAASRQAHWGIGGQPLHRPALLWVLMDGGVLLKWSIESRTRTAATR